MSPKKYAMIKSSCVSAVEPQVFMKPSYIASISGKSQDISLNYRLKTTFGLATKGVGIYIIQTQVISVQINRPNYTSKKIMFSH
jgi:hypothetical protein